MPWARTPPAVVSIKVLVPLFSLGLFTCCMVCHGELVRLKPHPRYLTHFYLMVSAGGALGGLFVGLLAPYIFNAFYEFQIGLVLCAVLVWVALRLDPAIDNWFQGWRRLAPDAAALLIVGMAVYLGYQTRDATRDARVLVRNFYGGLQGARFRPGIDSRFRPHPDPRHHQPRRGVSQPRPPRSGHHLLRSQYRGRAWPSATGRRPAPFA